MDKFEFNFQAERERLFLKNMFIKMPRLLIVGSSFGRMCIISMICFYKFWAFEETPGFIQLMLTFTIPILLEICFIFFSLLTAMLMDRQLFYWFGFFLLFTIGGFLYNAYHAHFFSMSNVIPEEYQIETNVTLQFLNVIALGLSEATGLLLVLDAKGVKLSPTVKPSENNQKPSDSDSENSEGESSEGADTAEDSNTDADNHKIMIDHKPDLEKVSIEKFYNRYKPLIPYFQKKKEGRTSFRAIADKCNLSDKTLGKIYNKWNELSHLTITQVHKDSDGNLLGSETQKMNGHNLEIN